MSDPTARTPLADEYDDLAPAASAEERLAAFLTEELAPELDRIRQANAAAVHKADLFQVGQRAIALRIAVSRELAEATRQLSVATAEETRIAVQRKAVKRQVDAERVPADVTRTEVRERVAVLQAAVDLLKYHRDDLGTLISFVQTAIRSMHDEEIAQLD